MNSYAGSGKKTWDENKMLATSSLVTVICTVVFSVIYGIAENRYFFENETQSYVLFNHFKPYHILMFLLFLCVAIDFDLRVTVWALCAMPLIQDCTWQVWGRRRLLREDWSNWGGFPLVLGLYWWYWVFGVIVALLGGYLLFR